MVIGTQLVEITKPPAILDEMVNSGVMVIMCKTGGIARRLDAEVARETKDLVKGGGGEWGDTRKCRRVIRIQVRREIRGGNRMEGPQEAIESEQLENGHERD